MSSSQLLKVSQNFSNSTSHSKQEGLQINISTLPGMCAPHNTKNEHQLPSVPHTWFRSSLLEIWPAPTASGEPNFVHTQQLCFCYSLRFVSKQTLFCFRQSLLDYDTKIWFRIFLFMQWLTYRKFYNRNSLNSWPFFLLFTNSMMLPSNLFFYISA